MGRPTRSAKHRPRRTSGPGTPTGRPLLAGAVADLTGSRAQGARSGAHRTHDDPTASLLQAKALIENGQVDAALQEIETCLTRHRSDRLLIGAVAHLLQFAAEHPMAVSLQIGPAVRAALLAVLADDAFEAQRLGLVVFRVICTDPACGPLLEAARSGADLFSENVPRPTTLVEEPVVLAALPRLVIGSHDLERIFTALRRAVLFSVTTGEIPSLAAQPLSRAFLCALARAAFLVEYAWLVEPDEAAQLAALQAMLAEALADPGRDPVELEDWLLVVALYESLGWQATAELLAAVPETSWSPQFRSVVREQVAESLAERAIAAELPALTPIEDRVSVSVRAMYEVNPYPRWRTLPRYKLPSLLETYRQLCPGQPVPTWPTPVPVLVAGAGTGRHPLEVAATRPEADVLAVDLSRPSLAYGARMARQLDIRNVRFAQADILALDTLDRRFALIECAGVLHHLKDPMVGWRVLRRLLRDDGLMKIGLYSERARASIVAARSLIASTRVPATSEGIQLARRLILSLAAEHPAASVRTLIDFFSLSGFRDLTMHVQEHRFTIPRLAASLDELGLIFLGFDLDPAVLARFRACFPRPGAELDLACWDQFEADAPDTFATMYQFWCRPR